MDPSLFGKAADIFGKFDDAKKALKKNDGTDGGLSNPQHTIILGDTDSESSDFLSRVAGGALAILGEAIEAAKYAVKSVVKVVVMVAGPIVKVLFKLFGKWIAFELKSWYNLLSALGNILHDVFGWDGLNRLLRYVKLALDPSSVKATQQVSRFFDKRACS
jgi:hypothetical protein